MAEKLENTEDLSPLKRAFLALERTQARLDQLEQARCEPIAIIGMGCRFPGGVTSPDQFWELLAEGRDAIAKAPANRWDADSWCDPNPDAPGKIVTPFGGFVDEVEHFDASFFGVSPREAMTLDPQQRLLLEVSYEAFEDAGMAPDQVKGAVGGVFVGICGIDYSKRITRRDPKLIDAYIGTGNSHSVAAGRLSYFFGLQGPSAAIDTACSSSLVALHWACQSLRTGDCDFALVGGVNLMLDPELSINFSKAHMLAPDGRCKTFDAAANGYVRGEGAAMVVLKPLSKALQDDDRILAVIRGSAVNQDGPSGGLTVPNGPAQQDVIRRALAVGQLQPDEIDVIEAHGTGTSLGDPIEMGALGELFAGRESPLIVGSVKTNIGHLEATAGVAGVMKVVLSLQREQIPPHLHFKTPSPHIPWDRLPVRVPKEAESWPRSDRPRRAGVSSFAFNGTNAHVVIEEAPATAPKPLPERPCQLLVLSGKTEETLQQSANRLATDLNYRDYAALSDVCFTASRGRAHHGHRLAIVTDSTTEAQRMLREFAEKQGSSLAFAGEPTDARSNLALMFSGQGAQYVGMGRRLYETNAVFRQAFQQCVDSLRGHLPQPLGDVVFAEQDSSSPLNDTQYTQPALFALEYSLAQLWLHWGLKPTVLIGHSVGEYVAACLAGVFSLEDGLQLIACRARLMQQLPDNGAMSAVFADLAQVTEGLKGYERDVDIAAINGSRQIVISGLAESVAAVTSGFEQRGIACRRLTVSHAFHSPLMAPMLAAFREAAEAITYHRPQLKIVSNLTGQLADTDIASAEYWVRHVRQPVRFADGVKTLSDEGVELVLEIGPQATLLGLARASWPTDSGRPTPLWLSSLKRGESDWRQMLRTLAQLYTSGQALDWRAYAQGYAGRTVSLPTYPFQRERYWLEPASWNAHAVAPVGTTDVHPLLGCRSFSAAAPELIQFDCRMSASKPGYLGDHRIFDAAVFPGAGFVEMAASAGRLLYPKGEVLVEDVSFKRAITLPGETVRATQVTLRPDEPGQPDGKGRTCELFSRPLSDDADQAGGNPQWTIHAAGRVSSIAAGQLAPPPALEDLTGRCQHEVSAERIYERLAGEGLNYGPCFRGMKQLWCGWREVMGRVALPESNAEEADAYQLHPALLDSCFHVMAGLIERESQTPDENPPFLPVGVQRLRLYRPAGPEVWSYARIEAEGEFRDAMTFTADLHLFAPDGEPVASLEGLLMQRVPSHTLLGRESDDPEDWLYELTWATAPAAGGREVGPPGRWLLFADDEGVADRVAQRLAELGQRVTKVRHGASYEQLAGHTEGLAAEIQIRAGHSEDYRRLLQEVADGEGQPADRLAPLQVIHLWSLSLPDDVSDVFSSAHELACGSTLSLTQALADRVMPRRLWLVTRGAQAVAIGSGDAANLAQAPLWALGRVIGLEHPDLRCVCVDLDPAVKAAKQADAVMAEAAEPGDEAQVGYRNGTRYFARLKPISPTAETEIRLPDGPYCLRLASLGVVGDLRIEPIELAPPGPEEVQIAVAAAGLNFRDILRALGMLEEYERAVAERLGITSTLDAPLGFECSGVVTAVGDQVKHVAVGDDVLAMAYGSLASHVTVKASWAVRKPESLSMAEAATIPMAFITALHGLEKLAHLKAGERVLIHAAAGGVGQAALQLARSLNADIYATASPAKWELLRSQGVRNVMNSRTMDFRDELLRLTNDRGVDVVLDGISGDVIPASLDALGKGGRFIEIGRLAAWSEDRLAAERPDVEYFEFDLDTEEEKRPGFFAAMFRELMPRFESNELAPLPHRVFPVEQVAEAMRFMSRAEHVGKVVVAISPDQVKESVRRPPEIKSEASYLVTGGLGGLGLEAARWLANRGAGHLVLVGRNGATTPQQRQAVEELTRIGAEVQVMAVDVSDRAAVGQLIETVRETLPPLRGVIHAAGVLDDGMLRMQNWSRFERVMRPKVAGAWHLHELVGPVEWFVMFSSGVGLIGSHGQGNYAAGNAFMDALAQYRRARGLAGLSIAWGPWADVGMTTRLDASARARMEQIGLHAIPAATGVALLERLVLQPAPPHVAAMRVDWRRLAAAFRPVPLWADLANATAAVPANAVNVLERLLSVPVSDRMDVLLEHVRSEIASVLGWKGPEQVAPREKLFDLGMDSLTSVELRTRLEASLQCSLPLTLAFDYPSASALAEFLSTQLDVFMGDESDRPSEDEELDENAEMLAGMSDEEVEALMAEKFKDLL